MRGDISPGITMHMQRVKRLLLQLITHFRVVISTLVRVWPVIALATVSGVWPYEYCYRPNCTEIKACDD